MAIKIDEIGGHALYRALKEESNMTIVDVRTPLEFQSEHIEGSVNLPIDQLVKRSLELPLESDLVFVCRTGTRAKRAAVMALEAGLKSQLLEGGILNWKKERLPVIRGKQTLAIDRQVQISIGLGILTSLGLGLTVNRWFLAIAAFFGAGLTYAGLSGTCRLAELLNKAPWNQLETKTESPCIKLSSDNK